MIHIHIYADVDQERTNGQVEYFPLTLGQVVLGYVKRWRSGSLGLELGYNYSTLGIFNSLDSVKDVIISYLGVEERVTVRGALPLQFKGSLK